MRVLGMIPPMFGLFMCATGGIIVLYYMFKGERRNRLAMFAFVVLFFGWTLFFWLEYEEVRFSMSRVVFKGTLALSILVYILGMRKAYREGDAKQQTELRATFRILVFMVAGLVAIIWFRNFLYSL